LQLDAVQERFRDQDTQGYLNRSVFVGHSMGGLISRLLIAHSGDELWNAVSRKPLECLRAPEEVRARLTERLFFDPYPMASRVVFIATPHRGSGYAGRAIGRLGSALVHQNNAEFQKVLADNPGAFREPVADGLPTSIDLLDPKQPLLASIDRLSIDSCVPTHSILGDITHGLIHRPGDGVVTVESGRYAGASSEKILPASHTGLLQHDGTAAELKRILREHLRAGENPLDGWVSPE
jgi:pimeloyl-ACP methyl ester carboxylesterase